MTERAVFIALSLGEGWTRPGFEIQSRTKFDEPVAWDAPIEARPWLRMFFDLF